MFNIFKILKQNIGRDKLDNKYTHIYIYWVEINVECYYRLL